MKPYTAEELRELNKLAEPSGEDSRMFETVALILDRLERLESHENAFYRQPKITLENIPVGEARITSGTK